MSTEDPRPRHDLGVRQGTFTTLCAEGNAGCRDRDCVCSCHDDEIGPYTRQYNEGVRAGRIVTTCPTCRAIRQCWPPSGCPDFWHTENAPAEQSGGTT